MESVYEKLLNANLFELEKTEKFYIPQELKSFLLETQYPWCALGKTLTAWLESLIQKISVEQRIKGKISPHAVLENPEWIVVEEGAEIEPHTFISGPAYISRNASIRQGAYIRGSVFVGENAVVGHTTEAKGAILFPHAKAAHFAYVGDSILGFDTNLGAGTKLANLRFDHKIVKISFEGQHIDTGLKKLGAILGNHAQTGCNSVTNPGTILLPYAMLRPNTTGSGVIASICK